MTNTNEPRIDRVGLETKFRSLQVERVERVTPRMLRVTLIGAELAGFASLAFDDHVKIAVPTPSGEMVRRDYTPRRFGDRALVLDFAVHDAGPATHWALNARPGDTLVVGGPRGSAVLVGDVRRFLLIGDETALPAIGRFIEEAKPDAQIASVVAVAGAEEEQRFETAAKLQARWAHRPLSAANDPNPLLDSGEGLRVAS